MKTNGDSQKMLIGKTLQEKQSRYYNGCYCPYCDNKTEFVDSVEVYQQSYGMMYLCRGCNAHVGVHFGTDQALGSLAKKTLRELRHEAHKWFDPLWLKKAEIANIKKNTARQRAYKWLAGLLSVEPIECHIGFFTEEQCRKVIFECKKFYNYKPQSDVSQHNRLNRDSATRPISENPQAGRIGT